MSDPWSSIVDPSESASSTPRPGTGDGAGSQILVIDSGIETSHPDLAGPVIRCFHAGHEGHVIEEPPLDVFGHGTGVASILRAMVPQAEIHSFRILDEGLKASPESTLQALRWAIAEGYPIVNCSFGTSLEAWLPAFKRLVDEAYRSNTWLVCSSNNINFRRASYPAHFPAVFAVTHGSMEDPWHIERIPGELVEYRARGENVQVAWKGGGKRSVTGSSFAAPHVAALLLRLREAKREMSLVEAKAILDKILPRPPGDN